jgi:hypothetical protein
MQLTIEKMAELEDNIIQVLPDRITEALTLANRSGELDDLLRLLRMTDLLEPEDTLETYRSGKIMVIGESDVKDDVMLAIAKSLGLEKNRFEFVTEYDKAKAFEFTKLQYASTYRLVLFGPVPHSANGKGDSGSVIAEMEKKRDVYPRVERLLNGTTLKITKSNFREKLRQLIDEQYI